MRGVIFYVINIDLEKSLLPYFIIWIKDELSVGEISDIKNGVF